MFCGHRTQAPLTEVSNTSGLASKMLVSSLTVAERLDSLDVLRQLPDQFPILVVPGFRQNHTLAGPELRGRGTAARLRHLHRDLL